MMNLRRVGVGVISVLVLWTSSASADARLAHLFQDNMVLQRDKSAPVWGWAEPGTPVEVSFAGQTTRATADADGRWMVALEPLSACREGRDLVARLGQTVITRRNVLVGEVWLAAGQSNMNHGGPDKPTGVYPHYVSPKTGAARPAIRIMTFGWGASLEPLADIDPVKRGDSPWRTLPENPPAASMNLSRYFARILRDDLDVPVGIVHVAVSGTNQAAWMAKETLEAFPGSGGKKNFYQAFLAGAEAKLAKSKGPIRSWSDFQRVEAEWRKNPKGSWPARSIGLKIYAFPSSLYNTRIHPAAPFALRGVIWHQGEAGPGGPYGRRLAAMVGQWRKLFRQDFTFIWGSLTRSTNAQPPLEPAMSWFYRSNTNLEIRKAADLLAADGAGAFVELYDLGDHETHFGQKAEAGRRMGLAALTVAYDRSRLYTGPHKVEAVIEGAKAVLHFEHVGEGLVYKPSIDGISGFIVKGAQGPLRWAEVKVLDRSTVEISHPDIAKIVTIAYGVAANPHETLFNSAGLPASPFRINAGRVPYGDQGVAMVRQLAPKAERGRLNLAHVRRDGYMFQLRKRKAPKAAAVAVEATIPDEWPGVDVTIGGKAARGEETVRDGRRFLAFDAPLDGRWIIVAAKGKADAFKNVDRY